jgi:hypothetical protein
MVDAGSRCAYVSRGIARFALALCIMLACATPASATIGDPETPITEPCRHVLLEEGHRFCGTLNPLAVAKVGYYFAYNVGATCTGGAETQPGEEVQGQGVTVTSEVTGLQPHTQYTVCLVATNPAGETVGAGVTFTTPAQPPWIIRQSATAVTPTGGAILQALIDAEGEETSYGFVYGTDESLSGAAILAGGDLPGGPDAQSVEAAINAGLTPDTTYYYRVLATNAAGTSAGPIGSFSTPQAPLQPTGSSEHGGDGSLAFTSALSSQLPVAQPKPITRAHALSRALRACMKRRAKRRLVCERLARRKYGVSAAKARRIG